MSRPINLLTDKRSKPPSSRSSANGPGSPMGPDCAQLGLVWVHAHGCSGVTTADALLADLQPFVPARALGGDQAQCRSLFLNCDCTHALAFIQTQGLRHGAFVGFANSGTGVVSEHLEEVVPGLGDFHFPFAQSLQAVHELAPGNTVIPGCFFSRSASKAVVCFTLTTLAVEPFRATASVLLHTTRILVN